MLPTARITPLHANAPPVETNDLAVAPAAHGDRQRDAEREQLKAGERQDQPVAFDRPGPGHAEHRQRHGAENERGAAA